MKGKGKKKSPKNNKPQQSTQIFALAAQQVLVQSLRNFHPFLLNNSELLNFEELKHKGRTRLAKTQIVTLQNSVFHLIAQTSFTLSEKKRQLKIHNSLQPERLTSKYELGKLQLKQELHQDETPRLEGLFFSKRGRMKKERRAENNSFLESGQYPVTGGIQLLIPS